MITPIDFKAKLSKVSAKTLSLGGKSYLRSRAERDIKFEPGYKYTPLPTPRSIRVLKILPGRDTDVVSCKIEVLNLDADPTPEYEALSYSWGLDAQLDWRKREWAEDTRHEKRPIRCDGATSHITMNLYHALTELRRQNFDGWLWADQICIEQDNDDEKAAQVAIMEDIYRAAKRVTVWLGKMSSFQRAGLDFMASLTDDVEQTTLEVRSQSGDVNVSRFRQMRESIATVGDSLKGQWHWLATSATLQCDWFQRAWTLQEFLLARDFRLMLGPREIPSIWIVRAARQMLHFFASDVCAVRVGLSVSARRVDSYLQRMANMFDERIEFANGRKYTAAEYLSIIRVRAATNPKDKIIAGAALLKEGPHVSPVYPMTTCQIYSAFATDYLWPEQGVAALSLVGGANKRVEGLPSWMPDLSLHLHPKALDQQGHVPFEQPLGAPSTSFLIDGNRLRLRAVIWDMVEEVGESSWCWEDFDLRPYNQFKNMRCSMDTSTTERGERFGLMLALVENMSPVYEATGTCLADVFWQTLIAAGDMFESSNSDVSVWRDHFQRFFVCAVEYYRSEMKDEKERWETRVSIWSKREWLVPLVAERDQFEKRVASFVDWYDRSLEAAQSHHTPLSDTFAAFTRKDNSNKDAVKKRWALLDELEELASITDVGFYQSAGIFGERFASVYSGRRLFRSQRGHLGLGSESVRQGDRVLLVEGARVPYVFRPVAHVDNTYHLLGEAYVHGLGTRGADILQGLDMVEICVV